MSPQKIVRCQARQTLRGNYAKAIIGLVIALLPLYMIDGGASALAFALATAISGGNADAIALFIYYPVAITAGVLLSPFFNGYVRLYYRNAFSEEMDMKDMFFYFSGSLYARTLRLNLSYALRMLIPALLFFSPVIIYSAICGSMDNGFINSAIYSDFYFILNVMSLIITTLYSLKYFVVFTLYVENEKLGNKELFDLSKYIMKGHGGAAARLIFSYAPWMLLCLLVLPAIYVIPYMTQGLCISAKWMTQAAYKGWE